MPPEKLQNKEQVQPESTQTTVNHQHHKQINHWTPTQNQRTSQVAEHPPAQQPCTHAKCTWHTLRRRCKVILSVLLENTTQYHTCTSQANSAAQLPRHDPQQLKHAARPFRGGLHYEEMLVNDRLTSLPGGEGGMNEYGAERESGGGEGEEGWRGAGGGGIWFGVYVNHMFA